MKDLTKIQSYIILDELEQYFQQFFTTVGFSAGIQDLDRTTDLFPIYSIFQNEDNTLIYMGSRNNNSSLKDLVFYSIKENDDKLFVFYITKKWNNMLFKDNKLTIYDITFNPALFDLQSTYNKINDITEQQRYFTYLLNNKKEIKLSYHYLFT